MGYITKSALLCAVILILIAIPSYPVSASEDNKINPDVELNILNGLIGRGIKDADVYYNRAWLYALKGEAEKAKEDYTHAIKLDNRHADAYFNRGLILLKEGLYEDAVNDFSKAIDIKPEAPDTYCNRGNAYFLLGKAMLALEDYNSAIEISGEDPDLYYNRAIIYQALGRDREAKDDFSRASELRESQVGRGQRTEGKGQ